MKIELKTFGKIKEIINDQVIEINGDSVESLLDELKVAYPVLPTMIYAIAVNNVVVREEKILQTGDEVCLLPPFAGG